MVESHTLSLRTRGNDQIVDLTAEIQQQVRASGIGTGQAVAMVVGSTGALTTIEYEPGLVEHDFAAALERIAPRHGRYLHEETWHDDNGHSHVRASPARAPDQVDWTTRPPRRILAAWKRPRRYRSSLRVRVV